jgi:hypothetical protein
VFAERQDRSGDLLDGGVTALAQFGRFKKGRLTEGGRRPSPKVAALDLERGPHVLVEFPARPVVTLISIAGICK